MDPDSSTPLLAGEKNEKQEEQKNKEEPKTDSSTPLLAGEEKEQKKNRVDFAEDHIAIEDELTDQPSAIERAVNKDITAVTAKLARTMSNVEESDNYDAALSSMILLQSELNAQIHFLKTQKGREEERKDIREHGLGDGDTEEKSDEKDTEDLEVFWTKGRLLVVFFIVYLILSNLWFIWRYNMHLIDSMFIVVIIFTSVGYGIEIVEEEIDQFVIICITIFGVFMVATGAGIVFEDLAEDYAEKQKKFLQTGVSGAQSPVFSDEETVASLQTNAEKDCLHRFLSKLHTCSTSNFAKFFGWVVFVFLGGILIGWFEGWHVFESIYFIVMSGTTVGFGDYTPATFWGKFLIIFYLPMVVASTAYAAGAFFSSIMYSIVQEDRVELQRFKKSMSELLNDSNFNTNLLLMDFDGDGKIDEKEFMLQVLVNEYNVPEKIIARIKNQFNKLDEDGSGFIDDEDFARYQLAGMDSKAKQIFNSVKQRISKPNSSNKDI